MSHLSISEEICVKCGLCVQECPVSIISGGKSILPKIIEERVEYCYHCGHCAAVCPTGAFNYKCSGTKCLKITDEDLPSKLQIENLLKFRRSNRHYKQEKVNTDLLKKFVSMADLAPSARNIRPVHWTIISDDAVLRKIITAVIEFIESVEKTTAYSVALQKGKDIILRGAPHLLIAHSAENAVWGTEDSIIALTNLEIVAPIFGLGACWAGFVMRSWAGSEQVKQVIDLPKNHIMQGGLMLGIPEYKFSRIPFRTPLPLTIRD